MAHLVATRHNDVLYLHIDFGENTLKPKHVEILSQECGRWILTEKEANLPLDVLTVLVAEGKLPKWDPKVVRFDPNKVAIEKYQTKE